MKSYKEKMRILNAEEYTYRNVLFHRTAKGFWVFADTPPHPPYSWHNYLRDGDPEGEAGMKMAIDRCLHKL